MKNADSQVAPQSTDESFSVVQSQSTMLERHHEGQHAPGPGGTQHLFNSLQERAAQRPRAKYNAQSKSVFDVIRELMTATEGPKRLAGFHS
jgi:hypothetical protein